MSFVRKIKKPSGTYLALVESYREDGKTKQRVLKYLGREVEGKPVRRVITSNIGAESVKRYGDLLAIDKLSKDLNLNEIIGKYSKEILLLTYSHILDNLSIKKIQDWINSTELPEILGIESISTQTLYETLTYITEKDFRKIEENIYQNLKRFDKGKTTLVIDVTDTYFEGKKGSSSRKRRGKDGKVKNLLQICLAVTLNHGFPVSHRTYGGNISNMKIFTDMSSEMKLRGFSSIIVDRGMYSNHNLDDLIDLKLKGIVGVRKEEQFVNNFLKKINRDDIYSLKNRIGLKNTKVYAQAFPYKGGEIIAVYNPLFDAHKREIHYEKGGTDEDAKYLGYSLIYHNTKMSAGNVVKRYFEKDIVEKAFKQVKGILSLRPVRVWMKEHVEGHVRICYLSYAILSLFNYIIKDLDIGTIEALDKLKRCYRVHLRDKESGFSWSSIVTLEKIQENILKKIGVVYKN